MSLRVSNPNAGPSRPPLQTSNGQNTAVGHKGLAANGGQKMVLANNGQKPSQSNTVPLKGMKV